MLSRNFKREPHRVLKGFFVDIKSILALTDFSIGAEFALDRAAMIAADQGATLQLMYLSQSPHPRLTERLARLSERGCQLAARHGIEVCAMFYEARTLNHVIEKTLAVDLLVFDGFNDRNAGSRMQGISPERLIRHSCCPTLVVKNVFLKPYAITTVVADYSSKSRNLLRYACDFEIDSMLEVFCAWGTVQRANGGDLRSQDDRIEHYCRQGRRRHHAQLLQVKDVLSTRRNRIRYFAGAEDPFQGILVQTQASESDLLIIESSKPSVLSSFVSWDLSHRLAKEVHCDFLQLPYGYLSRTHPDVCGASER